MNRIHDLRTKKGVSLAKMASDLVEMGLLEKISDGSISRYENNEREPRPKVWKAMATYFGVTVAYLQGLAVDYQSDDFSMLLDTVKLSKDKAISEEELDKAFANVASLYVKYLTKEQNTENSAQQKIFQLQHELAHLSPDIDNNASITDKRVLSAINALISMSTLDSNLKQLEKDGIVQTETLTYFETTIKKLASVILEQNAILISMLESELQRLEPDTDN